MNRQLRVLAAGAALVVTAAGCGFNAYSLPLPGGAATGKTYDITAEFTNVDDLVPQNAVRVNDVPVGDIESITVGRDPKNNIVADVKMRIRANVALPANSVATLQQTTLLGEKYVELGPPVGVTGKGRLKPGTVLTDLHQTTIQAPTVEQVFGLLSNVLNGGSLQEIKTINEQVSDALNGRTAKVRDALNQLNTFVDGLNSQRTQIVRAIDSMNDLSSTLSHQDGTIATALDQIGPGLKVLANQRVQLVTLLRGLSTFGVVATKIINASQADTVDTLKQLQPILGHLAAAGSNLPHALELLLTYPFPKAFSQAAPGDYTGLYASFDADALLCGILDGAGLSGLLGTCPSSGSSGGLGGLGGLGTLDKQGTTGSSGSSSSSSAGSGTSGSTASPAPSSSTAATSTPNPIESSVSGLTGLARGQGS